MQSKLSDCRVCIIGLGLTGGSLAMALRGQCAALAGCDVDPRAVEAALRRGLVDCGSVDVRDVPQPIDLLVLAAPVRAILDWLPRLPDLIPGPCHLIDLGSTKARIVEAMARLPERISPLGAHPMCGKESAGLDAASGDLFQRAAFVLTPLDRTSPLTLALAHQLIAAVGARPLIMDADRHDRIAAAISHVPYLAAVAQVAAAEGAHDEMAWAMAASGFRDSTRLAASNVRMMLDVIATNRAHVLDGLAQLRASIDALDALIRDDDESALRSRLDASRARRAEMT